MKNLIGSFLTALLCFSLSAQVVEVDPPFPTQNDTVTITFDATQGNGALVGVVPVYAHTGIITAAGGPGNWQNVQGNWGTADNKVLMNFAGPNKHTITYHIPTYYGVAPGTTVNELSFVFRNTNGSIVGRAADGSDIFYPVYPANSGFLAQFFAPTQSQVVSSGTTLNFYAAANQNADFEIYDNGVLQTSATAQTKFRPSFAAGNAGNHLVELVADNGTTIVRDTVFYVVNPSVQTEAAPAGTEDGINYISNSSVVLQIHAPFKNNIYVIGDFNNWRPDTAYFMRKTPTGDDWWVRIDGLTPGKEYAFQYLIDGDMRIAEPYSEKILDPWNDQFIDNATYPNLMPYPDGKTTGIVSVLQTDKQPYNWQVQNFTPPAKDELMVYELLIRDFVAAHNYQTLIDTLDYLENLGINAIELMPVNEFEANESWGYNPSFHMALDKYYGTPEKFKEFIDECHSRGIAVIIDKVLNHAFGQCPLVQMYFDPNAGQFGQPTAQNPWFNEIPRHDFNVGYDFNHQSQATKNYVRKVSRYWLEEYKIDGYRWDLSKGFTQNNTLGNIGAWNAYDQSRIDLLTDIKNDLETINPNFYNILEHFADNSEERELSNRGFMLWGNMNHVYNEASMGWIAGSDFKGAFHSERGWTFKHLIAYQESHDEQRMMYRNLNFGNSAAGHNTRALNTALARMELTASFFYTIPGPKMLWQFGELGYEVDINVPSRTGNKPIRWNYWNQPARRRLYDVQSQLMFLRKNYPTFNTNSYRYDFSGNTKRMNLDGNPNATIIGNFDVVAQDAFPNFQSTGWWYEYFSGDSINVTDVNGAINLQPGEYRIYTDQKIEQVGPISVEENPLFATGFDIYPNPVRHELSLSFLDQSIEQVGLQIRNLTGAVVRNFGERDLLGAAVSIDIADLPAGVYFIEVTFDGQSTNQRFVKL